MRVPRPNTASQKKQHQHFFQKLSGERNIEISPELGLGLDLLEFNFSEEHFKSYVFELLLITERLHALGWGWFQSVEEAWGINQQGKLWLTNTSSLSPLDGLGKVIELSPFALSLERPNQEASWATDLLHIGIFVSKKILSLPLESQKVWETWTLGLKAPNPLERFDSCSSALEALGLALSGSHGTQHASKSFLQLQTDLDLWCGQRQQHRAFMEIHVRRSRAFHYNPNTGWNWDPSPSDIPLPNEVIEEIVADFKKGNLVVDTLLEYMSIAPNRGIPLEAMPFLGLEKSSSSASSLYFWLTRGVLVVRRQLCHWSSPLLAKTCGEQMSEDNSQTRISTLARVLGQDPEGSPSRISQVLSLVQKAASSIQPNVELLRRSLENNCQLERWVQAQNNLASLHQCGLNESDLAVEGVRCFLGLGQAQECLRYLKKIGEPQKHLSLIVDVYRANQAEAQALTFLETQLKSTQAPWLRRRPWKRTLPPESPWDFWTEIVKLMGFNPKTMARHFQGLSQHHPDARQLKDLRLRLMILQNDIKGLNTWTEQAEATLSIPEVSPISAYFLAWLEGGDAVILRHRLHEELSRPIRRSPSEHDLANSLTSLWAALMDGSPLPTDITHPLVLAFGHALEGQWGKLNKLTEPQWDSADAFLDWKCFLWYIGRCWSTPPPHSPAPIPTLLKCLAIATGQASTQALLQALEELRYHLEHPTLPPSPWISQKSDTSPPDLIATIICKAIEDLYRLGWVSFGAPALIDYEARVRLNHQQRRLPLQNHTLLSLSESLRKHPQHRARCLALLSSAAEITGATHAWLHISWGKSWLEPVHWKLPNHSSISIPQPDLEGAEISSSWKTCEPLQDGMVCRLISGSRHYVLQLASEHYRYCFGPNQFQEIHDLLRYASSHLEEALSTEWTRRYIQKLLPASLQKFSTNHQPLGSNLETLEQRFDTALQELKDERDRAKAQNEAWLEEVKREMQEHDHLKTLGRLVATLAHEINNPNSFIAINAPAISELWQAYHAGHPDITPDFVIERLPKLIEAILEGSQRIDQLVKDLKNFARGNHQEIMIQVDLKEVIQSTLRINKKYIETHTRNFHLKLPENISPIMGIPHRLEQAFTNILHNACDALTEEQQGLFLTVKEFGNEVLVIFQDEGQGMDEETQQQIFEPFFTTKNQKRGMGVGMSVVRSVLDSHQARIQIQSALGLGCTITLSFPKVNQL
jgi:signal transduction histidine kinase